jgi:hypothetical protein
MSYRDHQRSRAANPYWRLASGQQWRGHIESDKYVELAVTPTWGKMQTGKVNGEAEIQNKTNLVYGYCHQHMVGLGAVMPD